MIFIKKMKSSWAAFFHSAIFSKRNLLLQVFSTFFFFFKCIDDGVWYYEMPLRHFMKKKKIFIKYMKWMEFGDTHRVYIFLFIIIFFVSSSPCSKCQAHKISVWLIEDVKTSFLFLFVIIEFSALNCIWGEKKKKIIKKIF